MSAKGLPESTGFTIGICASDDAERLPALLSFVRSESFRDFRLDRVVVVSSECPDSVLSESREVTEDDGRFEMIVESQRHGKADAINKILERSMGTFLVMVNADALPEPGSIEKLLAVAQADPRVGCASANPVFDEDQSLVRRSLFLMWSAHSFLSMSLNHMGISNHACDELLVVRKSLMRRLPENLVNDGAYIGGLVRSMGYSVRFSTSARVRIEVPTKPADVVRQRRRILFGHLQVWKKLGRPPKTIESLLFLDPKMSARTVVGILSRRPSLLLALPTVAVGELFAGLLAIADSASSTSRHSVWRRTAGRQR